MHTIDLAYVGRGLHEELVAYIADQQDFYADEGVHVALRDGCAWDEERLRRGATIGLGRTLLSRLNERHPLGRAQRQHPPPAVLVPRPPRPDLAGRPGRPAARGAPPAHRTRVLRPDRAAPGRPRPGPRRPTPSSAAPGDYGMDLRRLQRRQRSTPPSSATPWRRRRWPPSTAGRCWPGSATTSRSPPWAWPSTPPTLDPDDPAVQAVVRAHRRALQVIQNDPDTTVRHIRTFLGRHTEDEVRAHYEAFIAPYFTTDGQADLAVGATAHHRGRRRTRRPPAFTAAEFYRTAPATA